MWDKIKNVFIIALATLGVLFIIIMLIPDDDTDSAPAEESQQIEAEAETADEKEPEEVEPADEVEPDEKPEDDGNTVTVSIPDSELSPDRLKFNTLTLDNKEVSEKIFADYDITIVHLWGTFCQPCIAEMGEYAELDKELPDNINLIAIVSDVYDGIDVNVSRAEEILSDNDADFKNLRTSDDLHGIVSQFQFVPSSFFVDSEGHVIGEIMDGASCSDTKERLAEYIK